MLYLFSFENLLSKLRLLSLSFSLFACVLWRYLMLLFWTIVFRLWRFALLFLLIKFLLFKLTFFFLCFHFSLYPFLFLLLSLLHYFYSLLFDFSLHLFLIFPPVMQMNTLGFMSHKHGTYVCTHFLIKVGIERLYCACFQSPLNFTIPSPLY